MTDQVQIVANCCMGRMGGKYLSPGSTGPAQFLLFLFSFSGANLHTSANLVFLTNNTWKDGWIGNVWSSGSFVFVCFVVAGSSISAWVSANVGSLSDL